MEAARPEPVSPARPAAREAIRTREVGWGTLLVFVAVCTTLLVGVLLLKRGPAGELLEGPGWWENLCLFALLLLAAGGVVFGLGRLRPADLGLGREGLAQAVVVVGGLWVLGQLMAAAAALATGAPLEPHPAWGRQGVAGPLLWAGVMFLATAPYEEIAFRGFLYPQLFLKARGGPRLRFWTALLVSQLLFAAAHLPAHILMRGLSGAVLWRAVFFQGLGGVVMLLAYLRTRNLWIAIGLHGLVNAPTPLFAQTVPWEIGLLALLLAWPRLVRDPAQRGLAGVERVEGAAERPARRAARRERLAAVA